MEVELISTINPWACGIGLMLCLAGVVATFFSRGWSALVGYAGLLVIYLWGDAGVSSAQAWFWGVAALIAWGICMMLPSMIARSRAGVGYITGAALAGAFVGMLISHAGMIVGAVVGAFCGALAYSRTPGGKAIEFPSSKFLHYLCAKGLPAVVAICIMCVAIAELFALG